MVEQMLLLAGPFSSEPVVVEQRKRNCKQLRPDRNLNCLVSMVPLVDSEIPQHPASPEEINVLVYCTISINLTVMHHGHPVLC